MTALQTLQSINKNLETTPSPAYRRASRVAERATNARRTGPIATTMRSDNSAMSAVTDSLGLGAAQVDVAYTAHGRRQGDARQSSRPSWSNRPAARHRQSKIQSGDRTAPEQSEDLCESALLLRRQLLNVSKMSVQKIIDPSPATPSGGIHLSRSRSTPPRPRSSMARQTSPAPPAGGRARSTMMAA